MREFLKTCGVVIVCIGAVVASLTLAVLTLALPFIAIGIGLGFIGWTFCLFVGFC